MDDKLGKPVLGIDMPCAYTQEDLEKAKKREEMFKKMTDKSLGDQDTLSKRMGYDLFK